MLDIVATPEFIIGGAVALICVISVLVYLRSVDNRLMECDRPMDTNMGTRLTISPDFRSFVTVCTAFSFACSAAMLRTGFAGTPSELIFALVFSLVVILTVCFFALPVFLTSIHVCGDTLTIRSPLGQRQVCLGRLTYVGINARFQFELCDARGSVRFCHYVHGKRALIEHIIEHAPSHATQELKQLLQKVDKDGLRMQPSAACRPGS